MPNDIHSTLVETRGGNSLSQFVRRAGGSTSFNRHSNGMRGHGRGNGGVPPYVSRPAFPLPSDERIAIIRNAFALAIARAMMTWLA